MENTSFSTEDLEYCSGWGMNPWPPAQQKGALPTELTRQYKVADQCRCESTSRDQWEFVMEDLQLVMHDVYNSCPLLMLSCADFPT